MTTTERFLEIARAERTSKLNELYVLLGIKEDGKWINQTRFKHIPSSDIDDFKYIAELTNEYMQQNNVGGWSCQITKNFVGHWKVDIEILDTRNNQKFTLTGEPSTSITECWLSACFSVIRYLEDSTNNQLT